MNKIISFLFGLGLLSVHLVGQSKTEKILYIVDSIIVGDNIQQLNKIPPTDISEMNVIKNKESLKLLHLEKYDGAIYIFTKEYRKRSKELKQVGPQIL